MILADPIKPRTNGRCHVAVYARYSTEEQRPTSIPDQFAFVRRVLAENNFTDPEIQEISDEGVSGEQVNRPGIDLVRHLIDTGAIDLLVCEDSSRLYRNPSACLSLVEAAVDAEIRVVCINDRIDTATPHWHEDLQRAQQRHTQCNDDTRARIRRSHDGLWKIGAAVTHRRPGYKRRPTHAATLREPEQGPFYDEIDETWAAVVRDCYERVARGDSLSDVARWLTVKGLPKGSSARSPVWSDLDVWRMIQSPIYRGFEVYRVTVAKKVYKYGKSRQVTNDDPKTRLTRRSPHLQIVDKWLWDKANEAIARRRRRVTPPAKGRAHAHYGVPRDSRHALSGILICGACGEKMRVDGRREGGYRCRHAKSGICWNRATVLKSVVHSRLSDAITDHILTGDGTLDAFLRHVQQSCVNDAVHTAKLNELDEEVAKYQRSRERVQEAIAISTRPVAALIPQLEELSRKLDCLAAEREQLAALAAQRPQIPTIEELREVLGEVTSQLLASDRSVNSILKRLIPGKVCVDPYQQFDSTKVVLRAEFELDLVALLPLQLMLLLNGAPLPGSLSIHRVPPIRLDLFEPSNAPKYALRALTMFESSDPPPKLKEISAAFGLCKQDVHRALVYGRKLREAGLTDPYVRLTSPPIKAAHWNLPSVLPVTATATPVGDIASASVPFTTKAERAV